MIIHVTDRSESGYFGRTTIQNTNDIGVAWCFGARYHLAAKCQSVDLLKSAEAVIATMWKTKLPFEERWMELPYQFKKRWPDRKLIIYQEAEASWAGRRPWDEQKAFYELIRACDMFLTHNESDVPLYRLMCGHDRVFYFPAVQDLDCLKGIVRQDDGVKRVAVAAYDQRWNGIQAALVASSKGYPVVQSKARVFVDGRDEELPAALGIHVESRIDMQGWEEWARAMSKCWAYLHPLTVASAGRDQIACAAIGVPVIGNRRSTAQELLWPALSVDPDDIVEQGYRLSQLEDPAFYETVCREAKMNVDRFSIDTGVRRAQLLVEKMGWPWPTT